MKLTLSDTLINISPGIKPLLKCIQIQSRQETIHDLFIKAINLILIWLSWQQMKKAYFYDIVSVTNKSLECLLSVSSNWSFDWWHWLVHCYNWDLVVSVDAIWCCMVGWISGFACIFQVYHQKVDHLVEQSDTFFPVEVLKTFGHSIMMFKCSGSNLFMAPMFFCRLASVDEDANSEMGYTYTL